LGTTKTEALIMATAHRPINKTSSARWEMLWLGTGYARRGLANLLWATIRLGLAVWLWGTAIRLAHFPPPLKTVGAVLAIVSLVVFLWGAWGLWQGMRHLGLRNFALTLTTLYLVLVTFNILTIPDSRSVQNRVVPQFVATGWQVWTFLRDTATIIVDAPDDFLFAYTGSGVVSQPPGFPTPDPAATPVRVIAQPAHSTTTTVLKVGGYARVVNTDGQLLSVRAGPGLTYDLTAGFPEGERLLILEGPQSNAEGKWWKVHGPQGEGWCVDKWLTPSD
jgi:hypothetical protein